jgi:glutamine synthetase
MGLRIRTSLSRGVLGVGHAGILERKELAIGDCGAGKSAAEMGEGEREELGIKERMPLSWEEAKKRTVADRDVRGIFGCEFVKKYLSANIVSGQL